MRLGYIFRYLGTRVVNVNRLTGGLRKFVGWVRG